MNKDITTTLSLLLSLSFVPKVLGTDRAESVSILLDNIAEKISYEE